jgi:hypothetical protein
VSEVNVTQLASNSIMILLYLGTQKNTSSRRPEEKYELRKESCADMNDIDVQKDETWKTS